MIVIVSLLIMSVVSETEEMAYTQPNTWAGQTTLWIKTDGDDLKDGLSEANAVATWGGLIGKMSSADDRLWTVNVVPGTWTIPNGGVSFNAIGDNSRVVIQPKSGSVADIILNADTVPTADMISIVRGGKDNLSYQIVGTATSVFVLTGPVSAKDTIAILLSGEVVLTNVEVAQGLEGIDCQQAGTGSLDLIWTDVEVHNAWTDGVDTADSAAGCNVDFLRVDSHDNSQDPFTSNADGFSFHGSDSYSSTISIDTCSAYNNDRGFTFNKVANITASDCDAYDNSFADYYLPNPKDGTLTDCLSRSVSGLVTAAASVRWVGGLATGGQGVTFVTCSFSGKAQGLLRSDAHAGGAPASSNAVTFDRCTIDGTNITQLYQAGGLSTTSYLNWIFKACTFTAFQVNLDNTDGYNAGTPAASPSWTFENCTIIGGTNGLVLTAAEINANSVTWLNNVLQSTACIETGIGVTFPDDFTEANMDYNGYVGTTSGTATHDQTAASLAALGIDSSTLKPTAGGLCDGNGTTPPDVTDYYGTTDYPRQNTAGANVDIGAWQMLRAGNFINLMLYGNEPYCR